MSNIIDFPNISEAGIVIERSEKFNKITQKISDFLYGLSLSKVDNDHLIGLLINHLQEAEKTAFLQGVDTGCMALTGFYK